MRLQYRTEIRVLEFRRRVVTVWLVIRMRCRLSVNVGLLTGSKSIYQENRVGGDLTTSTQVQCTKTIQEALEALEDCDRYVVICPCIADEAVHFGHKALTDLLRQICHQLRKQVE